MTFMPPTVLLVRSMCLVVVVLLCSHDDNDFEAYFTLVITFSLIIYHNLMSMQYILLLQARQIWLFCCSFWNMYILILIKTTIFKMSQTISIEVYIVTYLQPREIKWTRLSDWENWNWWHYILVKSQKIFAILNTYDLRNNTFSQHDRLL